jgi:hypothetical protein
MIRVNITSRCKKEQVSITVDFSSNMMQLMTQEDFGAFLVSDQHLQPFRASCLILMTTYAE